MKFNLFREENEGYAKLISELLASENDNLSALLGRIRKLIGMSLGWIFMTEFYVPKPNFKLKNVKIINKIKKMFTKIKNPRKIYF